MEVSGHRNKTNLQPEQEPPLGARAGVDTVAKRKNPTIAIGGK
jgi:hypothetical protein